MSDDRGLGFWQERVGALPPGFYLKIAFPPGSILKEGRMGDSIWLELRYNGPGWESFAPLGGLKSADALVYSYNLRAQLTTEEVVKDIWVHVERVRKRLAQSS